MSVAEKIATLRDHLTAAYAKIGAKAGTVPTYKNSQNLANAIDAIPQYDPLTLAYISYGDGLHAQPFVDLMAKNGNAPVGSAEYAFSNTATAATHGLRHSTTDLTALDLSGLDLGNVTDTVCMFDDAQALKTLTWADEVDFGNVESMEGMYRNTKALSEVDLSRFKTSEYLESVFNLFAGSGVQTVTLGENFDTSGVEHFYGMFNSCDKLVTINGLDTLDMAAATDLRAMFYNCSSITALDLSGVKNHDHISLSKATADHMLAGMTNLGSLNLAGWKSGADDLAGTNFWTQNTKLGWLNLSGPKRLSGGKLADALVDVFEAKQADTLNAVVLNNPTFFTTDGTTATLTDFSDVWATPVVELEMVGWDVSGVDPTSNSAGKTLTATTQLAILKIGEWKTHAKGVNLATLLGVNFDGANGYSGQATSLTELTITGDAVLKVYNDGAGEFKSENAFANCPIAKGTGKIFVPAGMVAEYKADAFWGKYKNVIEAIS